MPPPDVTPQASGSPGRGLLALALLVVSIATSRYPVVSLGSGLACLLLATAELARRRRAPGVAAPPAEGTTTRPTRDGWITLLLALGFAAGAANTGTNLLLLVACVVFMSAAGNALAARRLVDRVHARVTLAPTAAQGEALAVTIEVEAARRVDAAVTVAADAPPDALEDAPGVLALGLAPGQSAVGRTTAVALRRGWLEVDAVTVSTRAPFGLARASRRVKLEAPARALIVPALRAVPAGLLRAQDDDGEAGAARRWSAPEARDAVRGVREWRPGDDRRNLHPRASARHGALLVREHERPAPRRALVVLHLEPAPGASGGEGHQEQEDAAATLAASLVAAIVAERRLEGPTEVGLAVSGEGAPTLVGPGLGPALLERARATLALARPGPLDAGELERALGRAARGARVIVVTTAQDPAALRDLPSLARGRFVVVPQDAAAQDALFAGEAVVA